MCTVTVVPVADGLRLGCNRDELRSRSPALPPSLVHSGNFQAIYPRDADGGGTWVAANDSGLAFVILNVNLRRVTTDKGNRRTRGEIIPSLLACRSLDDAVLRAMDVQPTDYMPFRLIVTDVRDLLEVVSCGEFLAPSRRPVRNSPSCFTSSGLGDDLVEQPRQDLFRQTFADRTDWRASRQDEYHRHSWSDRQHLSVCMRRPDASTVSYTVMEMRPSEIRMSYHAGPPDEPAADTTLTIPRQSSMSIGY